MKTSTYSSFRENLSKMIDYVNNSHKALMVTRKNGSNAVLLSLDDYNSYEETSYLIRNPKNSERLMKSINSLENCKVIERELIE